MFENRSNLHLDLETYSSVDLTKSGLYRYCGSHDFEILLLSYAFDSSDIQTVDLANGEKVPQCVIDAVLDESVLVWAHNSSFERVCLSRYLSDTGINLDPFADNHQSASVLGKVKYLNPVSWRCSMVWSAYMGLPLSLENVGVVLGLDKQKLTGGKDLIRYFCKPCAATAANGQRTRNLPEHAPDKWEAFKSYNRRDVETELSIQARLVKFPVPECIWAEYAEDQVINDRGVLLDMTLVKNAIAADKRTKSELMQKMRQLTELDNPNSVAQLKDWLAENGLETDTLGKKAVAEILKTASEPLGEVLLLRQQLAKSSIKKYQAMETVACADNRARGLLQYYGANRTGRAAGRLIQCQNLPQNHMRDLEQARNLVRSGDFDTLELLYDNVPAVLSELIRTAFIPKEGCKFIVADFSSIERVVLAWIAGEKWVLDAYIAKNDLYIATASQMFNVPVEQIDKKNPLRQKGKVADLACVAQGQLVLTDDGLVPIENVTTSHRVWDGEEWVSHEGAVYRGEREVIEYDGLVATPDHLVWVAGQSEPIQFGSAAAARAHLLQTGAGGREIRLGGDHTPDTSVVGPEMEQVLCVDQMHVLWCSTVDTTGEFNQGVIKRLSTLLAAKADSRMARPSFNSGETALRKPKRRAISKLWRERNTVCFPQCHCSRIIPNREFRLTRQELRNRSHQQQRSLRAGEYKICNSCRKQLKQTGNGTNSIFSRILAILLQCRDKKAISRPFEGGNPSRCGNRGVRETKELENHKRTARVYDIRNAGRHHRFTVSGKLVHNCGYGGSVGALKAMGALDMGLYEDELKPLVNAWRSANPNIVRLWWDADKAAKTAVKHKKITETNGIRFSYQSDMLFIALPSGRKLAYVKPRIGENRFGSECVTYEGIGATKRWERIESSPGKWVENITQAVARDILYYALATFRSAGVVMHIHDEVVIEADKRVSPSVVCEQMSRVPPWAAGLPLRCDSYETPFYQKS